MMAKSEKKPRSKAAKKLASLEQEIEARRHDVEHALDVLRLGAHRELSFLPKGEKWLLPSVAFGLGLALSAKPESAVPTRAQPGGDARSGDDEGELSAEAPEQKASDGASRGD